MAALNTSASMEMGGEASPNGSVDRGTKPLLYKMQSSRYMEYGAASPLVRSSSWAGARGESERGALISPPQGRTIC